MTSITADAAKRVKDIRQIGDIITVTVAITIDGVTREGVGTGIAESEMGIKKAEHDALKRAGLHRVTVSLDTLRPERFAAIARSNARAKM